MVNIMIYSTLELAKDPKLEMLKQLLVLTTSIIIEKGKCIKGTQDILEEMTKMESLMSN